MRTERLSCDLASRVSRESSSAQEVTHLSAAAPGPHPPSSDKKTRTYLFAKVEQQPVMYTRSLLSFSFFITRSELELKLSGASACIITLSRYHCISHEDAGRGILATQRVTHLVTCHTDVSSTSHASSSRDLHLSGLSQEDVRVRRVSHDLHRCCVRSPALVTSRSIRLCFSLSSHHSRFTRNVMNLELETFMNSAWIQYH